MSKMTHYQKIKREIRMNLEKQTFLLLIPLQSMYDKLKILQTLYIFHYEMP